MEHDEYASRRNHERELFRDSIFQERGRAEKLVYITGAIPLTAITLADLHWFPAVLMVTALGYSIISYGLWFVNEYHGSSWRIYDARKDADLISPQAVTEIERQKLIDESKRECDVHSKKADVTVKYLAATFYFICSFFICSDGSIYRYRIFADARSRSGAATDAGAVDSGVASVAERAPVDVQSRMADCSNLNRCFQTYRLLCVA